MLKNGAENFAVPHGKFPALHIHVNRCSIITGIQQDVPQALYNPFYPAAQNTLNCFYCLYGADTAAIFVLWGAARNPAVG